MLKSLHRGPKGGAGPPPPGSATATVRVINGTVLPSSEMCCYPRQNGRYHCAGIEIHPNPKYNVYISGADPGFWKGGEGRGVWVINWQCAHRRCAPLGGLKACPRGTFEILDAFSCNLVHILSKN